MAGSTANLSGNGNVVFGVSSPDLDRNTTRCIRWTQSTGSVALPSAPAPPCDLPSGGYTTCYGTVSPEVAAVINDDGSAVVGTAESDYYRSTTGGGETVGPFHGHPIFAWNLSSNTTSTVLYNGHVDQREVTDASDDLGILILRGLYRWPRSVAPILIVNSYARGRCSADARTIAAENYVWTAQTGLRPLTQVLTSAGLRYDGWTDLWAVSVSDSGLQLCGVGTDPQGRTQGWFANLAPCAAADYNHNGIRGNDADVAAFFACLSGDCCSGCNTDINADGDSGTDADIEAFFRILSGIC